MIYYTLTTDCSRDTIDLDIRTFKMGFFHLFVPGEHRSLKLYFTRLFFCLCTASKAKMIAAYVNDSFAHLSIVVPKCFKFPFLKPHEYEIGPCYTLIKYRGRNIYPSVLKWIVNNFDNLNKCKFYIFVDEDNYPSKSGIEKAGFIQSGYGCEDRFKRFYID